MNTVRWYYRVFQSAPDLIRALLPGSSAAATALSLDPGDPGDRLYRFEALELKELSHRLDGVLWPRQTTGCGETGSPEFPVVLLEVQVYPDPGFHHRLAAQTYRFLQQHPQVEHWAVLVITPHNRLKLGPVQALQVFLEQQVVWLNLEELSQQPDLDPLLNLLNLLTLPVRPPHRRHHRPDPGPAPGSAGSPGRRPVRLPGPGRPGRLAGRPHHSCCHPPPKFLSASDWLPPDSTCTKPRTSCSPNLTSSPAQVMAGQFNVVAERDAEGFFVATVPGLPGCHTQARSLDQLTERVREAIELYLELEGERSPASN